MNKKLLIVGSIVFLVLLAGAAAYFFLSKKTAEAPIDVSIPKTEEKAEVVEVIEVKVSVNSALGSYLTDKNGRTLYIFTKDSPDMSACDEECVLQWPVFAPEKITLESSLSANDFGSITRKEGRPQATFKKYPLYYYMGDKNIGEVNGNGVGGAWFIVDPAKNPAELSKSAAPAEQKAYTLADVAQHGTPESCWQAIGGKVYDVTQIITDRKHPGGGSIVQGCGKDATSLYETRPMGSGTPHSEAARTWLASFYIGDLK